MKKKILTGSCIVIFIVAGVIFLVVSRTPQPEEFVRSVTTIRLKKINPNETIKVTGIVTPWKTEDISFEVSGRIEWVIAKNMNVKGGKGAYSLSKNGGGSLLGKIAPEDYELRLKTALAQVNGVEAIIKAKKIEIDQVTARKLDAALADMENAKKEYLRYFKLKQNRVVSSQVFEKAETAYKIAKATYKEILASVEVKRAGLKAEEAKLEQLKQAVKDARLDLKRTNLHAPFSGKIVQVYAQPGAYVKAGEKVVKLLTVDPILVKLDISPQLDRKFYYYQHLKVYPPGLDTPVDAIVNRKATVADSRTFTFSLELLVRNKLINVARNIPEAILKLPRLKSVMPIAHIKDNNKEYLATLSESIHEDAKGTYAWGATKLPESRPGAPVYKLRKNYLKLLPGEYDMLGILKYRIIADPGKLSHMQLVANVDSAETKDGEKAVLIRTRRMFRPGDLVKVILTSRQLNTGIYIPNKVVCSDTLKTWVYKIMRNKDGSTYVKRENIEIKGVFEDNVLIESPNLKPGEQIVDEGSQFIRDKELVNVKSVEQVEL
jgi:multidrug efflux pump subunit AcrA (membrane-fusion protein)